MALASAQWRRRDDSWRCYVTTDQAGALQQALFGVQARSRLKGGLVVNSFTVGTEHVSSLVRAPAATATELYQLLDAVRSDRPRALVEFARVTDPELEELRAVAREARWLHAWTPNGTGYWFDTRNSFEDLARRFSSKLRRNLKRDRKRMTEAHRIAFESTNPVRTSESLDQLQRFIELEATGWKGRKGTDLGSFERDYYREIVRMGTTRGRLRWYCLLADERPVAMHLCYRHHRTVWAIKTAYDEEFAEYSPGTALLRQVLEHLCSDSDVDRLHMLTSPRWLRRWGPSLEHYYRLRLFPPTLYGRMLHVAERGLARLTSLSSA
jgi:CelD/BcsL family acetyltransferase involved in cellulose biosynthesis